jgi:hypothetical protein
MPTYLDENGEPIGSSGYLDDNGNPIADAPAQKKRGVLDRVLNDPVVAANIGILKSFARLPVNAARLVDEHGGNAIREKMASAGVPGAAGFDSMVDSGLDSATEALKSRGVAQSIGSGMGQIAQLAVMPASAGGIIPRALAGGAKTAGMTALQTGDVDAGTDAGLFDAALTGTMGVGGKVIGAGIKAVAKSPAAEVLSKWVKESAASSYARMLAAPSSQRKAALEVGEGLADLKAGVQGAGRGGVWRSASSLLKDTDRVINRLEGARDAAWKAIDPAEKAVMDVPLDKIFGAVDEVKASLMSNIPGGKATVLPEQMEMMRELDELKGIVGMFAEDGVVNVKFLDEAKQTLQKWIRRADGYNPDKAIHGLTVEARKDVAYIVRQEFDNLVPDIGRINKEISFRTKLTGFAETLVDKSQLGQFMRAGIGGTAVGVGAGMYGLARGESVGQATKRAATWALITGGTAGLMHSVPWRSVSGSAKSHIADLIASGQTERVNEILRRLAARGQAN